MGNQVEPASIWEIIGGILGIVFFIFIPATSYFDFKVAGVILLSRVERSGSIEYVGTAMNILIGSILTLFQIWNIVRWYTSTGRGKLLKRLPYPGGAVTDEVRASLVLIDVLV